MTSPNPPVILSTMVQNDAIGGVFAQRLVRNAGQRAPAVPLSSAVVNPGPWRYRIHFDIDPGNSQAVAGTAPDNIGAGGVLWVGIGLYDRADVTSGYIASAYPSTGCAGRPPSNINYYPVQLYYYTEVAGYVPPPREYIPASGLTGSPTAGANDFTWGGGIAFISDIGVWAGPDPQIYYGPWWDRLMPNTPDLPTWPGPPANWFPGGVDTSAVQSSVPQRYDPDQDPRVDFDHPIVGVQFYSTSAVYSGGLYPQPFVDHTPPVALDGFVTLHNDITIAQIWPLRFAQAAEVKYIGGPLGTQFRPAGQTSFVNQNQYAWVDLGDAPDPLTGFFAESAMSGLVAVG